MTCATYHLYRVLKRYDHSKTPGQPLLFIIEVHGTVIDMTTTLDNYWAQLATRRPIFCSNMHKIYNYFIIISNRCELMWVKSRGEVWVSFYIRPHFVIRTNTREATSTFYGWPPLILTNVYLCISNSPVPSTNLTCVCIQ